MLNEVQIPKEKIYLKFKEFLSLVIGLTFGF